jgi:hypothetical protein
MTSRILTRLVLASGSALALAACGGGGGGHSGTPLPPPPVGPTCTNTIATSALPAPQVFHLGTFKVGQTVTVDVPAGTAGLSFVQQAVWAPETLVWSGQTLPNSAGPDLVKDPSGATVYDAGRSIPADGSALPIFFDSSSPTTGTLTIPNTSAALAAGPLAAGTWSFRVSDLAQACAGITGCTGGTTQSTYDVTAILRPGTVPATGTIDVAFYLLAGNLTPPLSAATAGADARLARMLSTLGTLLADAGLTLGTVTWQDLPPAAQTRFAAEVDANSPSTCGEVGQLLSYAGPGNTLNLFLVPKIRLSSTGVGVVVGLDGTIPGPSSFGGTVQSGALVSVEDLAAGTTGCGAGMNLSQCGPDLVAYVAAHEAGHFLGLYHTTESDGTAFDPISDTAKCACRTCTIAPTHCADGTAPTHPPTEVLSSDCDGHVAGCGGSNNLMFWLVQGGFSTGALSSQQAQVMRANPLVH